MTVKEVLEIEKRTEDNFYDIHFFYEGGWWRAYEMSAYLCNHLGSELTDAERLKPTKRMLKDGTEHIFVGLKLSSFTKYLPNIDIDTQGCKIDENHMVFNVKNLYDSLDETELTDKFVQWKSSVPLQEKKSKDKPSKSEGEQGGRNAIIRDNTLFGIAQKLLSYPIHNKTPNENTQFIIALKQELISIII